ncbi:septum site-determining protein MinC [Desulfocicer vacuolatum DSM 3385]|uniref:Probable septum site-determining protein MinC n=1 Tax=Desulfocicer vacuolatum DSM 3385 TaxID=1121400 RepID=A0A1W2A600_9BACT|nr:septum site-determining protein MinC [Desulfocicer vacuolatum]SMC55993.1 septum site-determining protein MinC [Desulfocicer vacuolatum DSM 3385]
MGTNDMPPVKLKGVGDGFWITVDPQAPEETIEEQLTLLFQRLRHLAINARITLDMGGATGCDELVTRLTAFLKETFQVGVVTLPPEKRSIPVERTRQRDLSRGWKHHRSDVLMLRGRVRSGQKIESRKHIVIMGNVNPGAEILAGGHVIVLGQLRGRVHAGISEDETATVVALEFRPTHVQIGGVAAAGLDSAGNGKAEIAVVEKGRIVVQSYLESNLFDALPWPEVM